MAGQLKVNGVTLATEESGTVTLEAPQIKDSSNNVILDQSGTNPVLKNVEVVNNSSMMFRNRIINGDMRIDQRNAGTSFTMTSSSSYILDRWSFWANGGGGSAAYTVQQSSEAPVGFTKSFVITQTAAYSPTGSEYNIFAQYIEGYNVADLGWGTSAAKAVTLSFWVRSSLTGTFGGAVSNASQLRSYPFTYTISSANTWEYKTITVPGDTTGTWFGNNNMGLEVYWQLGIGSTYLGTAGAWAEATYLGSTSATQITATNGATFYITGVQLEEGTVPTPFEHRPYGTELALCQRYYEWGVASGSGYGSITPIFDAGSTSNIDFKVTKRIVPSMNNLSLAGNIYPNNQGNAVPRYEGGYSRSFRYTTENNTTFWNVVTGNGGSAGPVGHQIIWTATAEFI